MVGAKVVELCALGDTLILEETNKVYKKEKEMKKGGAGLLLFVIVCCC